MKKSKIITVFLIVLFLFSKDNLYNRHIPFNSENKFKVVNRKKNSIVLKKSLAVKEHIIKQLTKKNIKYYFLIYFNILIFSIFNNILYLENIRRKNVINYKKYYLCKDDF